MTPPDFLQALFNFLKFGPRQTITIALFSGAFLILSECILQFLSIANLAHNYRPVFGVIFLASIILFVVHVVVAIWEVGVRKLTAHNHAKHNLQRLRALTEEEKEILRFYIVNETHTNMLDVRDGVVQGLVEAGIIYRVHAPGYGLACAHNISASAWNLLDKNKPLLKGTGNTIRTDAPSDWRN